MPPLQAYDRAHPFLLPQPRELECVLEVAHERPFREHGFPGADRGLEGFSVFGDFDADDNQVDVGVGDERGNIAVAGGGGEAEAGCGDAAGGDGGVEEGGDGLEGGAGYVGVVSCSGLGADGG
jgi:hypothetical protein